MASSSSVQWTALPVLNPPFGMSPNRLHTTPSAAAHVGLATATLEVDRCRRRLNIVYCKVGRKVLYKEADLVAFLEQCRVGG